MSLVDLVITFIVDGAAILAFKALFATSKTEVVLFAMLIVLITWGINFFTYLAKDNML